MGIIKRKIMEVINMSKIMNANTLEAHMESQINLMVANNYKGRKPKVVILMASDNKSSERYVGNKVKMATKLNIEAEVIKFDENVTNTILEETINELNNDNNVDGMILQLPVYEHLDSQYLINQICPYKDVDGLTWYSKALLESNKLKLMPCTPLGVKNLLLLEGIDIEGKNVVVVGRGETSGAPMAIMFRNLGATVTICHAKTSREDLKFYVSHADIVVSCVGKQNVLEAEWFKEGSVVIGVGFTYDENGKQQLDFDFDKVMELDKVKLVSQRTNCTGKATVLSLMYNTVLAYLG
jgi:methylenetetrahydrofolate dehydrogenase (NADP+)/methenyltetrahydrofolate cyclohydrolase